MEQTKSIEKLDLPDGKYYAILWACGYILSLDFNRLTKNQIKRLRNFADMEIRLNKTICNIFGCSSAKIEVEVIDGWLYIE